MVAIYIPVLQSPDQFYTHVPNSYTPNYKIAFMLRALHASNEAKAHKITCLGTAVTYHRRCRNPLRTTKLMAVLAEMVDAAEDHDVSLGDLKLLAGEWAAGLACYLHGAQKGVVMTALGAVAAYRLTFADGGNVVVPGVPQHLLPFGFKSRLLSGCTNVCNYREAKDKAKKVGEHEAVCEGLLTKGKARGKIKPWEKVHGLELALLSLTEAVLKFCTTIAWLYLGALMIYTSILLLLGS
ncbi:hypothetical protein Q7P35_001524 [Cladosporium inversicolor]